MVTNDWFTLRKCGQNVVFETFVATYHLNVTEQLRLRTMHAI